MNVMIVRDEMLLGCFSLSANIMLGAHATIEQAGKIIQYWENPPTGRKVQENREKIVEIYNAIRGRYRQYYIVGTLTDTVQRTLNDISLAILEARDALIADNPLYRKFAGSAVLSPLREGKSNCNSIQANTASAFISLACLKIADALNTSRFAEEGLLFYEHRRVDDETQAWLNGVRANTWAAIQPVRDKYDLFIDMAKNGDELEDAMQETREQLRDICRLSKVDPNY